MCGLVTLIISEHCAWCLWAAQTPFLQFHISTPAVCVCVCVCECVWECVYVCVCVCVCVLTDATTTNLALLTHGPIARYRRLSGSNSAPALQASAPHAQCLQCSMLIQPLNFLFRMWTPVLDMKFHRCMLVGSYSPQPPIMWWWTFLVLGVDLWWASWWVHPHGQKTVNPTWVRWLCPPRGLRQKRSLHSGEWG